MDHLSHIPAALPDLMFGLSAAYRANQSPQKVDLGVGAYRDDLAEPWVLPVIRKAKQLLHESDGANHEYLPITGLTEFVRAAQNLVFGRNSEILEQERVASIQTLSGTGALHIGAGFLAKFIPDSTSKKVFVSDPPYANHLPIFHHADLKTELYPYYLPATKGLDLENLVQKLDAIPWGSIVVLHACGHNPTGVDPSQEQWRQIAEAMKRRDHLPFFDCAYQGLATGDLENDAWAIRHFVWQGFQTILVAQSFAKNMGLYGERVGCLHVVASSARTADRAVGQLQKLQRVNVSTPPAFGARLAAIILNNDELFQEWQQNLKIMHGRIFNMRWALRAKLEANGTPGTWDHMTTQRGMFCFSGLDQNSVSLLRHRFHIFTTPDGRFSLSGLNPTNIEYVSQSIKAVVGRSIL